MSARLHVGNLPYLITNDELRTLFAQAGTVSGATVIMDRDTGTSKGFGFVEMTTRLEAENAIKLLDNYALDEHTLKVNMARPRIARGSGYRR